MEASKKSRVKLIAATIFFTTSFYLTAGSFEDPDKIHQGYHTHLEMLTKVTFAACIHARLKQKKVNSNLMIKTLLKAREMNINYQSIHEYNDYTLTELKNLYHKFHQQYIESTYNHNVQTQSDLLDLLEESYASIFKFKRIHRIRVGTKLGAAQKWAILTRQNKNRLSISEIEPQNFQS